MKKILSCAMVFCMVLGLFTGIENLRLNAKAADEQNSYSSFFNFNGDAKNTGTLAKDGELVGSPTFVAGHTGKTEDKAIQLSGTNYVKVDAKVFAPGESFSVGFWMMEPTTDQNFNAVQRIVSTGVWGDKAPGIVLGVYNLSNRVESWSKVISGIGCDAPELQWSEAAALYNDGVWRHVVGVFDGVNKKATIYLDGQVVNTYDYPAGGSPVTTYTNTAIGGMLDVDGNFFEGFSGAIDDLAVVPFAMTEAQVNKLKAGTLFLPDTSSEALSSSETESISEITNTSDNTSKADDSNNNAKTGDEVIGYIIIAAMVMMSVSMWGCLKLRKKPVTE